MSRSVERITTNNPVMESLLDATLTGDNRRLLLVTGPNFCQMLAFSKDHIKRLETELADTKTKLDKLELAIALCRVGQVLKVEVSETNE